MTYIIMQTVDEFTPKFFIINMMETEHIVYWKETYYEVKYMFSSIHELLQSYLKVPSLTMDFSFVKCNNLYYEIFETFKDINELKCKFPEYII